MRLPSRVELSPEQEDIFLEAPLEGAVVIVGPPGTGKTVMAVYRAKLLAKQGTPFKLVMFNKVLKSFTKGVMEELEGNVSTWHAWVNRWWQQAFCQKLPQVRNWVYDFNAAVQIYLTTTPRNLQNIDWGHLIVDEGQDFPASFYLLCNLVVNQPKTGKPALTVLADENQRLNPEGNSTISQIMEALSQKNVYSLTQNFRNTYEISRLAESFYVGAKSGLPIRPDGRHGALPEIRGFNSLGDEVRHIVNFAKLNDDQSIGVFVPTHEIRRRVLRLVRQELEGTSLRVQTFQTGDSATNLDIDAPGMLTVICDASCKGLEFDGVFVPQLQHFNIEEAEESFVRMRFYVMSSRARSVLTYSYSDSSEPPAATKLFPRPEEGIIEWRV